MVKKLFLIGTLLSLVLAVFGERRNPSTRDACDLGKENCDCYAPVTKKLSRKVTKTVWVPKWKEKIFYKNGPPFHFANLGSYTDPTELDHPNFNYLSVRGLRYISDGLVNDLELTFDPSRYKVGAYWILVASEVAWRPPNHRTSNEIWPVYNFCVNVIDPPHWKGAKNLRKLCAKPHRIFLDDYFSDTTGVKFYLDKINSTSIKEINPASIRPGPHKLIATKPYDNGLYQQEARMEIISLPVVKVNQTPIHLCSTDPSLALNTLTTNKNGAWSGEGIENEFFNPEKAGLGEHWAVYKSVNAGGCLAKDSVKIIVHEIPEQPEIAGKTNGCEGDTLILHATSRSLNSNYAWFHPGIETPFYIGQALNYPISKNELLVVRSVNSNGCYSNKATSVDIVDYTPHGSITVARDNLLKGEMVRFLFVQEKEGHSRRDWRYRWEFGDGGVYFGESGPHYFNIPGTFTTKLWITSAEGCIKCLTSTPTTVNDIYTPLPPLPPPRPDGLETSNVETKVYPNPFINHLTLQIHSDHQEEVHVQIFNIRGMKVFDRRYHLIVGNNWVKIDQGLEQIRLPGQYFMVVTSDHFLLKEQILREDR